MPTLRLNISARVRPRPSRAGRVAGRNWQVKSRIYSAIQVASGISQQRLHQLVSDEYAPTESVNCFLLWLAWRGQRILDNRAFSQLRHKWRSRFRGMGVPLSVKREHGRRSYHRHLEKSRATARAKKARKKATVIGAIEIALRRRLYDLVRRGRILKKESAIALVGCSLDELRRKLESQFFPGMSWANYGEWHIDHRKPCASFDLVDPREQATCFHWSNLQPLWALDNLSKGTR